MNNLDDFIDTLQDEFFEEAKPMFGEKGFSRCRYPKFKRMMKDPDGYAILTGECGDTMEMYLQFENNRVSGFLFGDGCASSSISVSFAAELTIGKTPDEILDLTDDKLLKRIGKLPENDLHCASLAIKTVQEALSNYMPNLQNNF